MNQAPGRAAAPKVEQEPADQAILDRYFSGDAGAVADLADRYAPRLYAFGLRMCGDSEEAQDLVQETFLNVLRY
ncbi:MAG: sigma factor, partial [Thermodesulfobacteriota bacterium]